MTTYFNYPSKEVQEELARIAKAIVAPGKGILAADESTATCGKRFAVSTLECLSIAPFSGAVVGFMTTAMGGKHKRLEKLLCRS